MSGIEWKFNKRNTIRESQNITSSQSPIKKPVYLANLCITTSALHLCPIPYLLILQSNILFLTRSTRSANIYLVKAFNSCILILIRYKYLFNCRTDNFAIRTRIGEVCVLFSLLLHLLFEISAKCQIWGIINYKNDQTLSICSKFLFEACNIRFLAEYIIGHQPFLRWAG